MVMEKQFEEIIYSRYQARIRDMRILKVDEGFEQILGMWEEFSGKISATRIKGRFQYSKRRTLNQ